MKGLWLFLAVVWGGPVWSWRGLLWSSTRLAVVCEWSLTDLGNGFKDFLKRSWKGSFTSPLRSCVVFPWFWSRIMCEWSSRGPWVVCD